MKELRFAALEYAQLGWAVFPLFGVIKRHCQCGWDDCGRPGKHPLVRRGLRDASTDPDLIATWWHRWPLANVGVATGAASGIVVIDVDRPAGGASLELLQERLGVLPPTLRAVTGGGGLHLVYLRPPVDRLGNTVGRVPGFAEPLANIDVRADGGSIVVAPSRHISGGTYTWVDPAVPPAPAPAWLRQEPHLASPPLPAASFGPGCNTGYGLAALRRELAELAVCEHGENNRLNQAAFALGMLVGGGELERSSVEEQLAHVASSIGLHQREISATIRSGLQVGMQRPRVAPHRLAGSRGAR
jgi:hypothetical protein